MIKSNEISFEIIDSIDSKELESIFSLYVKAGWWSLSDDKYIDDINVIVRDSFCFVAAFINGKIIGCGRAISDGISDAYIQDVVVDEKLRGNGIGAKIIEHIVLYLRKKNIYWIGLIAQPGTENFYKRLGFSKMKDHIPMYMENNDEV